MNIIKLNDDRIVNIDKVLYIGLVTLDKSEILWDRVDTTGGIVYVLIDNSHIIEKYESFEDAKEAFMALDYDEFIILNRVDIIVNANYVKQFDKSIINELNTEFFLFNGYVKDIYNDKDEADLGYINTIKELTGEKPIHIRVKLESLSIVEPPEKTEYIVGENFSSIGMRVVAHYIDGTSQQVENFEAVNGKELELGQTSVTIKYEENGIIVTAEQEITVSEE